MEQEMVICPKCGKPFPKKRQELGYRFCINCSPQGTVRPIIESIGRGEEAETVMHIVSQQEYIAIQRGRNTMHSSLYSNPDEEAPDVSTFEEQEESVSLLSPAEREAQLETLEKEQQGLSERTLEDLEEYSMDEEDETEDIE